MLTVNSGGTRPLKSQQRNQVVFVHSHPLLPARIPAWEAAMLHVDQSRPTSANLSYFIPPPHIITGTTTRERQDLFLENWLRLRVILYARLKESSHDFETLKTQQWRDFLGGKGGEILNTQTETKTGSQRKAAQDLVERIFISQGLHDPRLTWTGPITFCDTTYNSAADIPDEDRREILWELYEFGFYIELLHLDRILCPGQATSLASQSALELLRTDRLNDIFVQDITPLRSRLVPDYLEPRGLASTDVLHRAAPLEALRSMLSRWPGVPNDVQNQIPLSSPDVLSSTIIAVEHSMVQFYVQIFFECTGRPPLVPHVPPVM